MSVTPKIYELSDKVQAFVSGNTACWAIGNKDYVEEESEFNIFSPINKPKEFRDEFGNVCVEDPFYHLNKVLYLVGEEKGREYIRRLKDEPTVESINWICKEFMPYIKEHSKTIRQGGDIKEEFVVDENQPGYSASKTYIKKDYLDLIEWLLLVKASYPIIKYLNAELKSLTNTPAALANKLSNTCLLKHPAVSKLDGYNATAKASDAQIMSTGVSVEAFRRAVIVQIFDNILKLPVETPGETTIISYVLVVLSGTVGRTGNAAQIKTAIIYNHGGTDADVLSSASGANKMNRLEQLAVSTLAVDALVDTYHLDQDEFEETYMWMENHTYKTRPSALHIWFSRVIIPSVKPFGTGINITPEEQLKVNAAAVLMLKRILPHMDQHEASVINNIIIILESYVAGEQTAPVNIGNISKSLLSELGISSSPAFKAKVNDLIDEVSNFIFVHDDHGVLDVSNIKELAAGALLLIPRLRDAISGIANDPEETMVK